MPDWLSDLVPAYIGDTNVLRCPVHARTAPRLGALATEDPGIATSYAYEFSARPSEPTDAFGLSVPGGTMKAWKTKQLAWFGPLTPVVRCEAHGAVLNLGYGGEVWESGLAWESAAALRLRSQHAAGPEAWDRKTEAEISTAALNQLAWDWATSPDPRAREGRAAVRFAERAVELTRRQDPAVLDTLAASYAEAGRFDEAVQVMREAISRLKGPPPVPDAEETIHEFQRRLELYGRRRPYREER